jgi:hypothetical protein
MVSPAVAILGPLIAGPIADKLASRQSNNDKSSTGRYLRVMIAVACIFSALFYSLLLLVPTVDRAPLHGKGPNLKFNCDRRGAMVRLQIIMMIVIELRKMQNRSCSNKKRTKNSAKIRRKIERKYMRGISIIYIKFVLC